MKDSGYLPDDHFLQELLQGSESRKRKLWTLRMRALRLVTQGRVVGLERNLSKLYEKKRGPG